MKKKKVEFTKLTKLFPGITSPNVSFAFFAFCEKQVTSKYAWARWCTWDSFNLFMLFTGLLQRQMSGSLRD